MSASPERSAATPVSDPDPKPTDHDNDAPADTNAAGSDLGVDLSDDESVLSEVDEAQFDDFDLANVEVEDRPQLAPDEENLKLIGRHKRKRDADADAEGGGRLRRKKEGRREKKSRRAKDVEGDVAGGEERTQRRERKRREATPEDEELLDPATRMFWMIFRV